MEAVEEAAAWLEEAWERRSGWNAAMAPLVIRDYGQRVLKSTGSLRLESGGRRRGRRGCEGGVGSGGKGPGDRWSHVLLVSASRRVTALLWPPRATPVYLLYFSDMKYIPSIAQHESGKRRCANIRRKHVRTLEIPAEDSSAETSFRSRNVNCIS